jgi:hypothetical protein
VEILDENPVEFLVGLAENISLEAERAAVMVNAAVAARTRSTFLQAWVCILTNRPLFSSSIINLCSGILQIMVAHNYF